MLCVSLLAFVRRWLYRLVVVRIIHVSSVSVKLSVESAVTASLSESDPPGAARSWHLGGVYSNWLTRGQRRWFGCCRSVRGEHVSVSVQLPVCGGSTALWWRRSVLGRHRRTALPYVRALSTACRTLYITLLHCPFLAHPVGRSDVTLSVVAIRSTFCGYNLWS